MLVLWFQNGCQCHLINIINLLISMYKVGFLSKNRLVTLCAPNWRLTILSELTPMIFDIGLVYLGSKASNYNF